MDEIAADRYELPRLYRWQDYSGDSHAADWYHIWKNQTGSLENLIIENTSRNRNNLIVF